MKNNVSYNTIKFCNHQWSLVLLLLFYAAPGIVSILFDIIKCIIGYNWRLLSTIDFVVTKLLKILFLVQVTAVGSSEYYNNYKKYFKRECINDQWV